MKASTMLIGAQLTEIWLGASDLEKSCHFYERVLGFRRFRTTGEHSVQYHLGSVILGLHGNAASKASEPGSAGLVLRISEGIERVAELLEKRGIRPDRPLEQTPLGKLLLLSDPDGHSIAILEPTVPAAENE